MLEHYASLITLCFRKQGPALLPPDSDKLCSLAGLVNSRAVSCTELRCSPCYSRWRSQTSFQEDQITQQGRQGAIYTHPSWFPLTESPTARHEKWTDVIGHPHFLFVTLLLSWHPNRNHFSWGKRFRRWFDRSDKAYTRVKQVRGQTAWSGKDFILSFIFNLP